MSPGAKKPYSIETLDRDRFVKKVKKRGVLAYKTAQGRKGPLGESFSISSNERAISSEFHERDRFGLNEPRIELFCPISVFDLDMYLLFLLKLR